MAPTEILADQHLEKIARWLEPLGVKIVRLTGRLKASERPPRWPLPRPARLSLLSARTRSFKRALLLRHSASRLSTNSTASASSSA